MAGPISLDTLQNLASMLRDSYVSHALAILAIFSILRYVVAALGSGASPFELPILPSVVDNVQYRYAVAQLQGRRPYMEDRHVAVGELNGDSTQSFYGLFDGHGGVGAANYCVEALCQNVIQHKSIQKDPKKALKEGFVKTDKEYLEIANRRNSEDGTTAVAVLTRGEKIYVAHVGDSRAIIVNHDDSIIALTDDHKPNRKDERDRVQQLGGSVVFWGVWRVEGILAVSRAIGDRMLKQFVVGEPEVKETSITSNMRSIVLASDGVWDMISNDEAGQIVNSYDDPKDGARKLMEEAFTRGSMDNICVMVVDVRAETNSCTAKEN